MGGQSPGRIWIVATHNPDNGANKPAAGTAVDSEQYLPALHGFLVRRLQNADDAQDLAQETYLRFYQLASADTVLRPGAYLFRIAVNLIYEFRLKRGRDCVTFDSEMAESLAEGADGPFGGDPGEAVALEQQIDLIVGQIPRTYRKAFIMHKRGGLSCQEVAEALNLTRRSVEIYLARAIAYARNARWK